MEQEQPTLRGLRLVSRFWYRNSQDGSCPRDIAGSLPGRGCADHGTFRERQIHAPFGLAGLNRPDNGRVIALGEDLWRMSDQERKEFRLRHSGFIFQGYNLFPALTARQQLEMVLRWGSGESSRKARLQAEEMLELLGLGSKVHLRPGQLSGGEQQRVAIGRALIKEPTLVFADEPTAALDWAHGQQVMELLRCAAVESGATVLVVAP